MERFDDRPDLRERDQATSLAWSFQGRRRSQPGRTPLFGDVSINVGTRDSQGRSLANSPEFAERFRRQMTDMISRPGSCTLLGRQMDLITE